jgi:hypothetical protein
MSGTPGNMKTHLIRSATVAWFLLSFIVSGTAQKAVAIEKDAMHRLKFENEFVRLFDVLVPVGKATGYHVHLYDGVSVRVSNAQIVDESLSGEKKPLDMKFGEVTFGARPSPHTHRVVNTGTTDFRNIFIEVLAAKSPATAAPFPILSDGHVILIDNDRGKSQPARFETGRIVENAHASHARPRNHTVRLEDRGWGSRRNKAQT